MSAPHALVIEEYSENVGLGVEAEQEEFQDIDRPWDPESIRVTTKSFSLRNILDLIREGSLDLAPDFQRLRVWKPVQQTQLIESLLLQIPLPTFYFAEDTDGILRVVDGVQRLSTIDDFVNGGSDGNGGFLLDGLEYIADVRGKRFGNLPPLWKRRIYNTQIVVHVIAPSTPAPVMYDIFRRINTGGTPLNAQEIRHCVSKPRSRAFLKRLVGLPEFGRATGNRLRDQNRMIDREMALRFTAFWHLGPCRYQEEGTMDGFLLRAISAIDEPNALSDSELDAIAAAFARGLSNAYTVLGTYAFRKWPLGYETSNPFNRALFEAWTVEMARSEPSVVSDAADRIRHAARTAMRDDYAYIASISSSTGLVRHVHCRFATTRSIIAGASG